MRILIVDDSRAMRMIVMRTLRQAGYGGHTIDQAGDGVEALDSIRSNRPDLVLCDWNMPNKSGLELLEAAKTEQPNLNLGFVTSEGTAASKRVAMEMGACFFITKPFTSESFRSALRGVVA